MSQNPAAGALEGSSDSEGSGGPEGSGGSGEPEPASSGGSEGSGEPEPASSDGKAGPTRLAAQIRRIRQQLSSPEAIRHPPVFAELLEMYKQVIAMLDERRGRHRQSADPDSPQPRDDIGRRPAAHEPVPDAKGLNLKPNPLDARAPAELVAALRQYRAWAGDISLRDMETGANHAVAYNTISKALNGNKLPKLKTVIAIIVGCGGSEEDQQAFASAWRQIRSGKNEPPEPG